AADYERATVPLEAEVGCAIALTRAEHRPATLLVSSYERAVELPDVYAITRHARHRCRARLDTVLQALVALRRWAHEQRQNLTLLYATKYFILATSSPESRMKSITFALLVLVRLALMITGAVSLLWYFGSRALPPGFPLCELPVRKSVLNA